MAPRLAETPKTLGPAVASFFAGNLTHRKGPAAGKPFVFEPWQQEDINLIYEVDQYGRRVWRNVIWGMPRGQGKSPAAAGLGLLELATRGDAPDVFCAAGSRGQAAIVHGFAFDLPKGGPLEDFMVFPRGRGSAIRCPSNGGLMRVLSADGDLQHGLSVSVAIVDEPHVFKTAKQEELFFALATATQKRTDSVLLEITTAGANKDSLLGEQYDAVLASHDLSYSEDGCRVVARDYQTGSLMIWRAAPENADVSDQRVWRACNPASWIPLTELERLARTVPESVFRRLVMNQWVVGEDAAFQPGNWDDCQLAGEIPLGADVWVGVDIGERRDTSAVLMLWPHDGGKVRVEATVFNPEQENVHTLLPLVEAELRRIATDYQLRGVGFDPWQFRRSADILASEGLRMMPIPQNDSQMVPGSQMLHDLVEQKLIEHNGDRVLRKHALAAETKQTSRGAWRVVKPMNAHGRRTDTTRKVDAVIALIIGVLAWNEDESAGGDLWAQTW